jgi:hypothetical protein
MHKIKTKIDLLSVIGDSKIAKTLKGDWMWNCKILGFYSGDYEEYRLLGHGPMWLL